MSEKLCPSSPFSPEAQVFGMVGGTARARRVIYLRQPVPASQIDLNRLDGLTPEEVFRSASPCAKDGCAHHDGASQQCTLVNRVVANAPDAADSLAHCAIRPRCVWWSQHGRDACARCSQVVSRDLAPSEAMAAARVPPAQMV